MADKPTEEEMTEITVKLTEDGLNSDSTDEEKITHLWHMYIKSEASLKSTLSSLQELQAQQAEEMKEFEQYVEHVRTLSAEREALTVEFAAENDQLKEENDHLKQELDSYHNEETCDMLLQQGLDDIAHGTASEQIAYLLVERARLMDELEAEEQRHLVETPDGLMSAEQILRLLEQERAEVDDELKRERDRQNQTSEQLKACHEEEMNALMAENQHLQGMLDAAREKIPKSQPGSPSRQNSVGSAQPTTASPEEQSSGGALKRKMDELEASKEEELLSWKRRVRDVEHEAENSKDDVERITAELQREKTRSREQLDEYEEAMRRMREERKVMEEQLRDTELQNHKLLAEKRAIDLKLDFMEKEIEDLKQREQDLISKQRSQVLSDSDNQNQMKQEIESLQQDKRDILQQLEAVTLSLHVEKQNILDLELKVKRSEAVMDDQKQDLERQENFLKAKVKSLETHVLNLEDELANSQREVMTTKNTIKRELEANLTQTEAQLREVKATLQEVRDEKEAQEKELEREREQNDFMRVQLENAEGQLNVLQSVRGQLDQENDSLTVKLSKTQKECEQKERDLMEERDRVNVRHLDNDGRLNQAQEELGELQREIRSVTSDLYAKQETISQLERELEREKSRDGAQSQSEVTSLKHELESVRQSHVTEVNGLRERLDKALEDNQQLQELHARKQEELDLLRDEVAKIKATHVTLESSAPESDMAWLSRQAPKDDSQIQDLYKKNASLETINEELRTRLDENTLELSRVHNEMSTLSGQQSAVAVVATMRADRAEHMSDEDADTKLYGLQAELSDAQSRLQTAERDAQETVTLRAQLHAKQDEITTLHNQLHEEKYNRALTSNTADNMNQEMTSLRQRERDLQKRNNELQHMLLDVEARLETMKNQTKSNSDVRQEAEKNQKSVSEQAQLLQAEVEELRTELIQSNDKYDLQLQRYNERKNRTKDKLHKAREAYSREKSKLRGEVERLERDLSLTRATLTREVEWKDNLDRKNHELLLEKRELLSQLAEQEEVVRDHGRQLSVIQVRCKFLEEENSTLQQRVESVIRQKHNLDRIIKEYQFERHKEELHKILSLNSAALVSPRNFMQNVSHDTIRSQTSGLGNSSYGNNSLNNTGDMSVDETFNRYRSLDAIISPRVNSSTGNHSENLNRTMPPLNLYQNDENEESVAE